MEIQGTRVLVTGATGGLGGAMAEAFAAAGARLVLSGRDAGALEAVASRVGGGDTVVADLATDDGLAALVAAGREADVVVANAAVPASGYLTDLDRASIERAIGVNLTVPVLLARELAPGLVQRGRGQLLFVASLSGMTASKASSLYSATKFGLRGFALGLRQDLHGTGVGVSLVSPGFVRDAGMFAESGVTLPTGVGTSSPEEVGAAALRAVRQDLAEVVVAPAPMRVGAALGALFPSTAARITRALGGDATADRMAEGQRGWG